MAVLTFCLIQTTTYRIYWCIGRTFDTMKSPPKSSVSYTWIRLKSNIWHNLGGNTIILFFNIKNEYMNNKLINYVCFCCCLSKPNLIRITAMII